jgi:hypothetical protein
MSTRGRERPYATPPPLFVLTTARSYSSVVVQMLGCHPDLYAFPELVLFGHETVDAWLDVAPHDAAYRKARTSGTIRALAELRFGGQTQEGVEAARTHLESLRGQPTRVILDELLAAVAPRAGVEKSPVTVTSPAFLQRVLRWYPDARFVHLVRHPVATCESQIEVWTEDNGLAERLVPHRVVYVHRTTMQFLSQLPASQWRRVRAEDVLSDPAGTFASVLDWLCLRNDDQALEQLRHPERSPYAHPGPDGASGGNDPGFQEDPNLRPPRLPDSLELREDLSVTPLWREELAQLGRRLGYDG